MSVLHSTFTYTLILKAFHFLFDFTVLKFELRLVVKVQHGSITVPFLNSKQEKLLLLQPMTPEIFQSSVKGKVGFAATEDKVNEHVDRWKAHTKRIREQVIH